MARLSRLPGQRRLLDAGAVQGRASHRGRPDDDLERARPAGRRRAQFDRRELAFEDVVLAGGGDGLGLHDLRPHPEPGHGSRERHSELHEGEGAGEPAGLRHAGHLPKDDKAQRCRPGTDVSTLVHADRPIIAERSMYWGPAPRSAKRATTRSASRNPTSRSTSRTATRAAAGRPGRWSRTLTRWMSRSRSST